MSAMKQPWFVVVALGFSVVLFVGDRRIAADFELEKEFDPNEMIGALTVRLLVGADGEELAEPVALDLGLGFPLWLHPPGRAEGEAAPWGAVPQQSSADRTVPPNSVAEFTFALTGDDGQDELRTSSQLLDSVRISDISRIGFMSRGESKWVIDTYEIEINGRLFARNEGLAASVDAAQTAARERLAELEPLISPLKAEAEDIQLLAEAELTTDEDEARLTELDETLRPMLQEQNRILRQLNGTYPWYQEAAFESPWRAGSPIEQLRVSLATAEHAGADTRNYVYYRTGGHKYLLASPMNPLSSENGLRVIPLDLDDGPLTAADLRGHGLGMVAHVEPYGGAPDRWHPQRLLVEVDGSVVYDSDQNDLDRMSLGAIRIIPPAHIDETGNVVTNEPVERETYVWAAGQGQGLDLVNGGAVELPGPDDEEFPLPEPGLPYDEEEYTDADYYDGFEDQFEPFPGEVWYEEEWTYVDPGMGPDDIWIDPIGWDDVGGTPWWDILDFVDRLIDIITGNPAGVPVQVENVRLVNAGGFWDVQWDVFGDDSQVISYVVEVLTLQPHETPAITGVASFDLAAAWQRQRPVPVGVVAAAEGQVAGGGGDPLLAYLMPRVTPITAAGPEPGMPGAARALTELRGDTLIPLSPGPQCTINGAPHPFGPLPAGSAVWNPGPCQSHTGFLFDAPLAGAFHVALRAVPPDTMAMATCENAGGLFSGDISIVGHVGFADMGGGPNGVDAGMWAHVDGNWQLGAWPGVSNQSLQLTPIQVDFPLTPLTTVLSTWPEIQNNAVGDPQQPAVFFGLRAVRTGP